MTIIFITTSSTCDTAKADILQKNMSMPSAPKNYKDPAKIEEYISVKLAENRAAIRENIYAVRSITDVRISYIDSKSGPNTREVTIKEAPTAIRLIGHIINDSTVFVGFDIKNSLRMLNAAAPHIIPLWKINNVFRCIDPIRMVTSDSSSALATEDIGALSTALNLDLNFSNIDNMHKSTEKLWLTFCGPESADIST